jgi:hypothetical protein
MCCTPKKKHFAVVVKQVSFSLEIKPVHESHKAQTIRARLVQD